jgi:hypothetical protein
MPGTFVHAAGTPAHGDTRCACEQERRAREDERNCRAESEGFHNTERSRSASSPEIVTSEKRPQEYTYVGKKELNEQALKWKFCIKQNNHVLLSRHACLNPSIILTGSMESPTRSRSIRACAISRSFDLSQDVVRGVLGSMKKPHMATRAVTAPSLLEVSRREEEERNIVQDE